MKSQIETTDVIRKFSLNIDGNGIELVKNILRKIHKQIKKVDLSEEKERKSGCFGMNSVSDTCVWYPTTESNYPSGGCCGYGVDGKPLRYDSVDKQCKGGASSVLCYNTCPPWGNFPSCIKFPLEFCMNIGSSSYGFYYPVEIF